MFDTEDDSLSFSCVVLDFIQSIYRKLKKVFLLSFLPFDLVKGFGK